MSQTLTAGKRHGAVAFSGGGALAVAPGRLGAPSSGAPAGALPSTTQRPRTPLSVVPARPSRRRVPLAVFSLLILGAALAAVLMLNISVSSTQYELVQLRNEQVSLRQENEALALRIEDRQAPQNLAGAATKLGMVSSPTFGTIELDSKKVTGTPEPAKEGPKPEVLIAPPHVVPGQPAPAPSQTAPSRTAPADATHGAPAGPGSGTTGAGTVPGPEQAGSRR